VFRETVTLLFLHINYQAVDFFGFNLELGGGKKRKKKSSIPFNTCKNTAINGCLGEWVRREYLNTDKRHFLWPQ